jgi:hypothetical protein
MTMKMFTIYDVAMPCTENIRDTNLVAVRDMTIQETKLLL